MVYHGLEHSCTSTILSEIAYENINNAVEILSKISNQAASLPDTSMATDCGDNEEIIQMKKTKIRGGSLKKLNSTYLIVKNMYTF